MYGRFDVHTCRRRGWLRPSLPPEFGGGLSRRLRREVGDASLGLGVLPATLLPLVVIVRGRRRPAEVVC